MVEDEGIGVRVAETLMSDYRFPSGVEVMDAGTMGMGMLGIFREYEHVVIVDAVDGTGEPPGTIVRMSPEDIAPSQVLHSLHDVKLADVLQAATLMGVDPHVEFVGVQVASMREMVLELTPPVEAAMPAAVEAVFAILADLGIRAEPGSETNPDASVIRAIRTREDMRPRES